MPVYDYICPNCEHEKEDIIEKVEIDEIHYCSVCGYPMVRATNCSHFKLTYNPVTDICDWDGNRTKYWDEYKKAKAEGKDVRIPKHDGDG